MKQTKHSFGLFVCHVRTLLFLLLFAVATHAHPQDSKSSTKNPCLETEVADETRPIFADAGRMKIGLLAEHITWSDDYKRAANDVIQKEFASDFVSAGNDTFGTLILYISGTPAVSSGAQYVNVRLELLSSQLLLPENAKNVFDLHSAKVSDPIRVMQGDFVFADSGVLLPGEQDTPYQLWRALNVSQVQATVRSVLSQFVDKWQKAGQR